MENILSHYAKLVFYNFARHKGDNYKRMREYFATIFIHDIEKFVSLDHKKILDAGGARGEFCKTLSSLKEIHATNLDPVPKNPIFANTIIGSAHTLPFPNNTFDIVLCRGAMEHIPFDKQQLSVDEIYRVTKIDGFSYFVIPPWYNPHAGHSLKPFHILPFPIAKFLSNVIFRRNITANSLAELADYPITFKKMRNMLKQAGFKLIATQDIHFRLHFMTKIPLLNEVLVPAVAFVVKK